METQRPLLTCGFWSEISPDLYLKYQMKYIILNGIWGPGNIKILAFTSQMNVYLQPGPHTDLGIWSLSPFLNSSAWVLGNFTLKHLPWNSLRASIWCLGEAGSGNVTWAGHPQPKPRPLSFLLLEALKLSVTFQTLGPAREAVSSNLTKPCGLESRFLPIRLLPNSLLHVWAWPDVLGSPETCTYGVVWDQWPWFQKGALTSDSFTPPGQNDIV